MSLGQHFLNNARIPALMADAAEVESGDTVLEIGPGTGVLTRELLRRGARVIAIEADARAVAALAKPFRAEIENGKLIIIHDDVRNFPNFPRQGLGKLGIRPHAYKVVANIPYYLSGMLFRTFLETALQPHTLVFLVQREVAERIARDKKESLLSLSVKVFGDPEYVKTVARGNFTPPPRVDSAILVVTNISRERLSGMDEKLFFSLIHAGFASKRKQLIGNLTKIADRETLTSIFNGLGLPLTIRGEDVPLATWLSLAKSLALHITR